jgi:hypothetical protein
MIATPCSSIETVKLPTSEEPGGGVPSSAHVAAGSTHTPSDKTDTDTSAFNQLLFIKHTPFTSWDYSHSKALSIPQNPLVVYGAITMPRSVTPTAEVKRTGREGEGGEEVRR